VALVAAVAAAVAGVKASMSVHLRQDHGVSVLLWLLLLLRVGLAAATVVELFLQEGIKSLNDICNCLLPDQRLSQSVVNLLLSAVVAAASAAAAHVL
jgi:hypothetical protein